MNENTLPVSADTDHAVSKQKKLIRLVLLTDIISFLPILYLSLSSGSLLLISDSVDYLKSIATGLVSWNIIKRIERGKFKEFDYGYGKVESLGGITGSLIFIAGLLVLAVFSIQRIIAPAKVDLDFISVGAVLQLVGVAIYGWLWIKNKKLARQINAPLIEMQWRVSRADTITCFAVFSVLLLNICFHSYSWAVYIDPVSNIILVLYLAGSFIPSLADGLKDIMDKTLEEDLQLKILKPLTLTYDEYEAFHSVKSRRAGSRIFIDITLSFDPDKKVGEVTETINKIKTQVESDIPHSTVNVILYTEMQSEVSVS